MLRSSQTKRLQTDIFSAHPMMYALTVLSEDIDPWGGGKGKKSWPLEEAICSDIFLFLCLLNRPLMAFLSIFCVSKSILLIVLKQKGSQYDVALVQRGPCFRKWHPFWLWLQNVENLCVAMGSILLLGQRITRPLYPDVLKEYTICFTFNLDEALCQIQSWIW